jgi:UDP-N-acetyl-D-glucosamine dehydrogenase
MKFVPGPGLGGHCIPVDPHYLSWALREVNYTARFVELSAQVNNGMIEHVGGLVAEALNEDCKAIKNSRILLLGMAYKRDVGDVRESPALGVVELLIDRGSDLRYHDPYVESFRLMDGTELRSVELSDEELAAADCIVITTAHGAVDYDRVGAIGRCVVDTRNAMACVQSPKARILKI